MTELFEDIVSGVSQIHDYRAIHRGKVFLQNMKNRVSRKDHGSPSSKINTLGFQVYKNHIIFPNHYSKKLRYHWC